MKSSNPHRHATSLFEQLTEPSLNGVRTQTRNKRSAKSDADRGNSVPPEIYQSIQSQAKQQLQELDRDTMTETQSSNLLAKSLKAALSKKESDDEDSEPEWFEEEMEALDRMVEEKDPAMDSFLTQNAEQPALGDIVFEKIEKLDNPKKKKTKDSDGGGMDPKIGKLYEGVGDLLSRYTVGKLPKALRFVPNLANWEEVIYLTRPNQWSPHAYHAVTKLFLNSNPRMAQRFIHRILLPHLRHEIEQKQRLHLKLYEALKQTCHVPGAFYKGMVIPLCKSGTCTVREAVIFSSVIKKNSLPVQHSAAALLCLAEMEYSGPTSFFIQTLLSKNYAMPFKALDGLVEHFMRFEAEDRELPSIWHQSLLMFIQRYKKDIKEEDLGDIRRLIKKHRHHLITDEIYKEIDTGHKKGSRGEKDEDSDEMNLD